MEENTKPLGGKAYGSIPHLPGSNRGQADRGIQPQHARIFCEKAPSPKHRVSLQVKLDGSCTGVWRDGNRLLSLTRSGYECHTSPYDQHKWFARWVEENEERFMRLLQPGERCMGEWLAEAHGTRYELHHEPFVAFDILQGSERITINNLMWRASAEGFVTPRLLHTGGAISIQDALELLKTPHHGELDPVEGAVWRIELDDTVQDLAKYVRPDYVPGRYFSQISKSPTIYNWTPWPQQSALSHEF